MSTEKLNKTNMRKEAVEPERQFNNWLSMATWIKDDLKKSGIEPDLQKKLGIWELKKDEEVLNILGYSDCPKGSGNKLLYQTNAYAIPYPDGYIRIKLEKKIGDRKYLSPDKEKEPNTGHIFYIKDYEERLKKKGIVIWTEGEKKTACIQQWLDKEGYKNAIAIGFPGVTMWRKCLEKITATTLTFSGRKHYIAFDYGDIQAENQDVQREAFAFWLELIRRKSISASFFSWPDGYKGIDDYLSVQEKNSSPIKMLLEESTASPWDFLTLLQNPISGQELAIASFAKSHMLQDMCETIFKSYGVGNLYSITFKNFYKKIIALFENKEEIKPLEIPYTNILQTIESDEDGVDFIVADEGIFRRIKEDIKGKSSFTYKRICIDPIILKEMIQEMTKNGECFAKLTCNENEYIVPATALSGLGIKDLTALGFAIQTPNGKDMSEYFLMCQNSLKKNKTAMKKYSSRQGWIDDDCKNFVFGNKIITDTKIEEIAQNPQAISPNFLEKGDKTKWMNVVSQWSRDPQVQIAIGASIASPLLKPLCVEGKTLHFWGESSTGKSTLTAIAASIWGKIYGENQIVSNWLSSRCGIEMLYNTNNNMPTFLDDSQLAEKEYVFQAVMMYANGTGRPRGNTDMQSAKKTFWKGYCISTGEQSITDVSSFGGCTSRTIEILRKKNKNYNESDFSILRQTINGNYGFGADVIKYWLANRDLITQKYNDILKTLETFFANANPGDSKKSRVLPNLATIHVGAWIGQQIWGFVYSWDEVCNEMIKLMDDKPTSGTEKLYDELCSLRFCFADRIGQMVAKPYGENKVQYKYDGINSGLVKNELAVYHPGLNALCFYPVALETYLKSRNWGLSQVTGILAERNLLIINKKGHKQIQIKINGSKVWVYAIKLPESELCEDAYENSI